MSDADHREQLDDMHAGMVAVIDQLGAALGEFSAVAGDLFGKLQEQDFERAEALRLVEIWASSHFERAGSETEED
jgi:hypothetical protein